MVYKNCFITELLTMMHQKCDKAVFWKVDLQLLTLGTCVCVDNASEQNYILPFTTNETRYQQKRKKTQ